MPFEIESCDCGHEDNDDDEPMGDVEEALLHGHISSSTCDYNGYGKM
jgi:hypothetical protein